jgi:hypothetical protein
MQHELLKEIAHVGALRQVVELVQEQVVWSGFGSTQIVEQAIGQLSRFGPALIQCLVGLTTEFGINVPQRVDQMPQEGPKVCIPWGHRVEKGASAGLDEEDCKRVSVA